MTELIARLPFVGMTNEIAGTKSFTDLTCAEVPTSQLTGVGPACMLKPIMDAGNAEIFQAPYRPSIKSGEPGSQACIHNSPPTVLSVAKPIHVNSSSETTFGNYRANSK